MIRIIFISITILFVACNGKESHPIVFQTDFGVKDGAVAAMKGVALSVDDDLDMYDLTHEIPAYNIWEAAYRLNQVISFWPKGTVFVSVVDPGVGTERRSIVALTKSGHYIVTPDNGTLTLVADEIGIEQVRTIDEEKNRRQASGESYTFHGRDVYAYTAARLASGLIAFEAVGNNVGDSVTQIEYQKASLIHDEIVGTIPVLDIQYGNVWTNIPDSLVKKAGIKYGDSLDVVITYQDPNIPIGSHNFSKQLVFQGVLLFAETFGAVSEGKSIAYLNSLMDLSFAINMGNFASSHKISHGPGWIVTVRRH